jgi:septum site-determining protein MinC
MISIKGLRQGILIVFGDANTPWLSQLFELEKKLEANTNFFKGGKMALDVKGFALEAGEIARAQTLLNRYEVDLWAIVSENPITQTHVRAAGLMDSLAEPIAGKTPASKPISQLDSGAVKPHKELEAVQEQPVVEAVSEPSPEPLSDPFIVEGTDGLLVKKRVRSGQVLRHPGHIVVLGDVNPGAQLIAGGDVLVWGRLQGNVHAGALGDANAVICALELSPTLLKIADAARMARPDKRRKQSKQPYPEMASLQDQQITLSEWRN